MTTILIVDDKPIFREPIEAVLKGEGFDTVTASNGQEAIAALSASGPDLILLDLGMPVLDGLSVLRYLRQDRVLKATPVIVLSAEADRSRIVEAVRLGISGYVLKSSFSLKDLLIKIRALLGDADGAPGAAEPGDGDAGAGADDRPAPAEAAEDRAPAAGAPAAGPAVAGGPVAVKGPGDSAAEVKQLKPIMTRSLLLERLKACEELRGFSPTVSQVLKLTSSEKSSLNAISKAIGQDQAMALKVLKIANSSVYSRGDRVDTVHKAVLRIGLSSIRQTALNIAVVERFGSAAFRDYLSTPQFWEHSIACGIIAAELAHAADAQQADSAFTSGLLHDLGRVIFAEALGEEYSHVIQTARRLNMPLEVVESRMLLMNHADVMDRLLSAWKFPKHLVDPIMHHHASVGGARSAAPTRVAEILRLGLADRLAHAMLLGSSGNDTVYPTEEHCRALGVSGDTIRCIQEKARQQTEDTKYALLANAYGGAWPRQTDEVRANLAAPFRPLYISAAPEIDAYRLFCQELADPAPGEPPNVAVVHIASAKERELLAERIAPAEREAGVAGLPVLVLSAAAQWMLPDRMRESRRQTALGTPLPVAGFISACNALMTAPSAAAA